MMSLENEGTGATEIASGQEQGNVSGQTDTSKETASGQTAASAGTQTVDPGVPVQGAGAEGGITPPVFTPNFKFKIYDKDYEIPEWARGGIKDPEVEKQAREVFEKFYGFDIVKQDRNTTKAELAEAKDYIARTDADLTRLGQLVRDGDFDTFFGELKIPEDKILQYAIQLAERRQWTPEQRQAWQDSQSAKAQNRALLDTNRSLETENQRVAVQQREFEVNSVMSRQDVLPVVQAYNQGMGSPSAFKELVIEIGNAAWASRQEDLTAEQAVQRALRYIRGANPNIGKPSPVSNGVVTPSDKSVLPNIQGRGASPVRTTVKSLDDIKRITREREAQGI